MMSWGGPLMGWTSAIVQEGGRVFGIT
jgi:hypothetical protein